jgi:hypothetical protein
MVRSDVGDWAVLEALSKPLMLETLRAMVKQLIPNIDSRATDSYPRQM